MLRAVGCVFAAVAGGCLMANPTYLGESQGSGGMETTSGPSADASTSGGESSDSEASASGTGSGETSASASGVAGTTGGEDPQGSSSTGDVGGSEVCPQRPDLVACIPFDVEEPENVADESRYGNEVVVEGGGLVGSPWQQGFLFDALTRVEVDCPEACVGGATLTSEAWIRLDLPPVVRAGVLDDNGLMGMFIAAGQRLRCSTSSGAAVGGDVPLGEWVHVACVANDDALTAYVDGVQVAQRTIDPLTPIDEPRIALGNDMPSFGEPLLGALDRVRLWSIARSEAQIAEAANP